MAQQPVDRRGALREIVIADLGEPREKKARDAWIAAMRVRKAMQARIVEAFGKHVDGSGSGPTDEELLTFARLAIAEQRLARRLRQSP